MAETYNDFNNSQNFTPPQLEPDFSVGQKITAGAILGAQESLLLTGSHAVSNLYDGYKAKEMGEDPITREQLKELSPSMEYREDEYMGQAIRRHKYQTQREVSSIVSSQMGMAGQFGSGLLGGMVDTPFMLIPGGAAMRTAKAGERAIRTGTSFTKAKQLVDATFNRPTFSKAFVESALEQAIETRLVIEGSEYTGRDYGDIDGLFDFAFGTGLTTGMNVPVVAKANSIARQQGRMVADSHAMESFFTSGEYTEGATLLRKYSEDLDLSIKANPEVEAAINTPKEQRTPESEALVQDFIEQHIEDIAVARAKSEVQVDPDKPISEARAEAAEKVKTKVEQVRRKVNGEPEPVKELSPRAVVKEFDRLIKDLPPVTKATGKSVEGSRTESREEINIRVAQKNLEVEKAKKRKDRDTELIKQLEDSIAKDKATFVKSNTPKAKAPVRKSMAAQSGDTRSQMRTDYKVLDLLYDQQIDAQNNLDSSDPAALQELMDLDTQIKEYEKKISDTYYREYAQEISTAHKIVQKVFGIKAGELNLVRYDVQNKRENNLGEVIVGDNDIGMGAMRTWAESESYEMITPSQVVFHEALHVLSHTSPSTIKAIHKAIESQPKLKAKLEEHVKKRGYDTDTDDVVVELPSVLMEWLTTQPEFWNTLYKQDRTVFDQLVDFVKNLIKETQDILKRKGGGSERLDWVFEVNVDDLDGMTPEQLAQKMGIYFSEIKKGIRAKEQPAFVKPNSGTDINNAANKLDRDMSKANKDAAKRTVEKEKVRAQKVVQGSKRKPQESAKKAFDAVFSPRIQALLNSDPDPTLGSGPVYLEIIKTIREQGPNKVVADNLIDLAISIRDILTYQKKALETLADGTVVNPNYDLKDLINKGAFKDLEDTTVSISEAEMESLVAGMEPAEAARVRKETLENMKEIQNKVKSFQDTQQRTSTLFKELMFVRHKIAKGEMTAAEAKVQLKENIDVHTQSLIARQITDNNALTQYDHLKGKSTKHILKYLKTVMDGRPRKGVATKDRSVEAKVLAQIQEDQGAISKALISNGLYDLFMGVSTMSADVKMNLEAQAVYGQKLKEASNMFWKDLMDAARNQKIPDDWKGIKALEEVYEAFIATNENLRNQLNELGAGIRYREGFTGLSQRWNERSILQHGETQWRTDMTESIDWEATEAAHGGVMNIVTDKDGKVTDWQDFDKEAFLTEWYKEITSNKVEDHPSTDVVQSFGKHRAIVMKQDSEIPMTQKYSGHKSLGLLYMNQIRHRSEMIAIAKKFGTRPLPNFQTTATRLGLDPEASFKDIKDLVGASNTLNMKHLIATVEYLTGALDNPANKDLARYSKNFRKVSNLAFLPMSGVSALTDIPMIALTLQQSGVLKMDDMSKFLEAYASAHARRFGGDEATRQVLEGMGAGLDSALNAASSRVALADPSDPDILGKLNDAMFSLNYLNGITTSGQEAFMDVMTRSLAEQIQAEDINPLTARMLEDFGFTVADMKELAASVVVGDDGVPRVGPSTIKNPEVSRKSREMLLQLMNEAVMFPDAGTQALVRGGLQAGTVAGEIARDTFQYSSFPLSMTRIISRKFMTNYQGTSPWTTHQTGRVQMVAFVGSMLAMGYMTTVVKDLIRGREPMNLANMSGKGWERVVAQSGVAGILEPMLALGSGDVRGAVAPLPSTLFSAVMKETGSEKIDALRPLYGSSYPIVGPAIGKTIGWAFGESVQELQNNRAAFLEAMYKDQ
jgi:cytochrome c oxidase assembly protein Cox11